MWSNHGEMMNWGWGWLGMAPMLLFWLLLIVGLVALVRYLWSGGGSSREGGTEDAALNLLRERFARGEIDADEFEQRKRILRA